MDDWKKGWNPMHEAHYYIHFDIEKMSWGGRTIYRLMGVEHETLPKALKVVREDAKAWIARVLELDRPRGSFRLWRVW